MKTFEITAATPDGKGTETLTVHAADEMDARSKWDEHNGANHGGIVGPARIPLPVPEQTLSVVTIREVTP